MPARLHGLTGRSCVDTCPSHGNIKRLASASDSAIMGKEKMPVITPELQAVSVVLVGDFNPKIFQPAWFASQEMIWKSEADDAKIDIIHHEVTSFSLDWVKLAVTAERFSVTSESESHYDVMRDLVINCFALLKHTPIRLMGINRTMHFRMSSEDAVNSLGFRLVPPEPWQSLLPSGAMRSLTMESLRKQPEGYIRVEVEPSAKINPGIFIAVNHHYIIGKGAEEVVSLLQHEWASSLDWSLGVFQGLVK